MFIEPADVPET